MALASSFKIIPRTVIYAKSGRRIDLHGGGVAVKSYIHIRDVSEGELLVMEQGQKGEIYHLSPDGGVAVRDVVGMICSRLGIDFDHAVRIAAERLGQDKAYTIDSSKARAVFGWRPQISLEQGISQTVSWVEGNLDAILSQPLEYIHKE